MTTVDQLLHTGEFTVVQFFSNDAYETVLQSVSTERAVECASALAASLGGRLGTTRRIIITDGEDYVTFEWKHGEGVVFPTKEQCHVAD